MYNISDTFSRETLNHKTSPSKILNRRKLNMRTTYMDTTQSAKENRKWYVIDATDLVLGRL